MECSKEPAFQCYFCEHVCHLKYNLKAHMLRKHKDELLRDKSINNYFKEMNRKEPVQDCYWTAPVDISRNPLL